MALLKRMIDIAKLFYDNPNRLQKTVNELGR